MDEEDINEDEVQYQEEAVREALNEIRTQS